ncbi:MAG: hypothetical protein ACFFBX_02370, partial [Promethearchaeota archaeon]
VNEAVEVTADVVDQDLSVVELWYEYGSGWQHLTMSHRSGDTYNGTIPGQSYGTVVQYFVNASDEWGMTTWAMDGANPWSYTVADLSPPVVANVAHTPIPVTYLDAAHVTADVSDEGSGLDTVELYYSINGGGWLNTIMTVAGPGTYEATISAQSWNTDVDYYVNATDNMGLITIDDNGGANYTYTVVDNINPVIQNVVRDLGTVQYNDTVEVSCTATDPGSGIATVTLYYRNDSGLWYSTPMSYNGSHYVGIIPEHNSNAVVEYYVEATDNATNSAMSGTDNYTVQDDYPPEISDIDHWPTDVTASDSPDVNCTVIDTGSGINNVTLYYQVDGGGFNSVPMTHRGGGEYNGTIPAQSWGAFVEYYITAIDNNMNSITDNNGGIYYSYTVGDIVGPVIQNVGHTPTEVENDDSPVVSCDVTDPGSGVQFVELYYRIGGSGPFTSVLMTEGVAGHYTASIPIQAYGTFVEYYVNATDWANNWNTDPAVGIYYDYTVVDVTPPDIDNISQTPLSVVFTDSVIVSCDVTDSSTGVSTVMLYYRLNGGLWTSVSMSLTTPDHYEATIGVQPYGTLVEYYVNATDNDDNWVIDDDGGLNYSY